MPSPVPTPVAAALGLVPTVLGGVRRLPGRVLQLPVLYVSTTLTALDAARREYDDLAERGERLIARLRGESFDELEDRFEDALQGTRLAKPYDAVEDALEDAGAAVATVARKATTRATKTATAPRAAAKATTARATKAAGATAKAAREGLEDAADRVEDLAETVRGGDADAARSAARTSTRAATVAATTSSTPAPAKVAKAAKKATKKAAKKAADKATEATDRGTDKAAEATAKATDKATDKATGAAGAAAGAVQEQLPEAEQPKGAPTPKATEPDSTRVDTAASADVVSTVEAVSGQVGGGEVLAHDELPLPDYDHMTLGSLRGRMRSLTIEQLVQVRDYEKAHADRLPIVTMLDNRIAKLATDASQQPSGVPSDRPAPGQQQTAGGSQVDPSTSGPAMNPPSAGDPTNPAQPRSTG